MIWQAWTGLGILLGVAVVYGWFHGNRGGA